MLESWPLVVRCGARLLLVGGAITYSALAPALGLGDITLHSSLNQSLSADIALVDVGGLEEGELSVSLATADEFSRAGVERLLFLNNLKFTPILRGNRSLIRVTSSKAVSEPFLNFVVQLNQPNGRVLREYTVLIDPPGTPGIVPATDEPMASPPESSAFPSVKPAGVSSPPAKQPASTSATAPANDPVVAEQLAASVLQNQQLQTTVDELNSKLEAQDEQIAGQKQQVIELQTQLADAKQAVTEPVMPVALAPTPVVVEEPEATNWQLILGLLTLMALMLLGLFARHRRQQVLTLPQASADLPSQQESMLDRPASPLTPTAMLKTNPDHREETSTGDVLQVFGKQGDVPASIVVPVQAVPNDEFQLNLDDLSMESSWDLVSPFDSSTPVVYELPDASSLPELEWAPVPDLPSQDEEFLNEFSDASQSLELEPLSLALVEPTHTSKLEQAIALR